MADGSMQQMLEAGGVAYDRSAEFDPYSLLPKWVHPRKTA
jgi:cysteine synthase A